MSVPGSKTITIDDRPGNGLRADRVDALDPVQQVRLERDGDQLLDLLGRQAERLGLDLA